MSSAENDTRLLRPWNPHSSSTLIIAEIGTAHGGSLEKAYELIDAAVESGAECVKFQHVYADEIIHPRTGMVDLPGGRTPLYEVFKKLERSPDFLIRIKEHAERRKVSFLCTPFGEKSLAELIEIGCTVLKVASPELNHLPLLDRIAASGLPVLLSTGVSRLSDIEEALGHLQGITTALLHCITSYPAPEEEYNLRLIGTLKRAFGLPVGVSDHSTDPLKVPLGAVLQGACCIEKHFTLSRSDGGLDDPVALTPRDFRRMTDALAWAQKAGKQEIRTELEKEFGAPAVRTLMGTGKKELAPSEKANYGLTNRSLHARGTILPGETLSTANLAVLRTEKVLRPGLHPRYLDMILGRRAKTEIPAGEGIRWDDIG